MPAEIDDTTDAVSTPVAPAAGDAADSSRAASAERASDGGHTVGAGVGDAGQQGRESFDVCGDLPTGTTVLEASAGTGKTYTIAALAARYLAEGHVDLSQLMMVTFSRMATNELRMRVRERLVDCERALAAQPATTSSRDCAGSDPVLAALCTGSEETLRARHHRIRVALADFDAATIATTHEFCQTMLNGLGILGDHDPEATFVESLSELGQEIATDCYLHRFARLSQPPPFSFDEASQIARQVLGHPTARLVPPMPTADGAPSDPAAANSQPAADIPNPDATHRYGFAANVRDQLAERKRRRRLYSFDDMQTRLRNALSDPVSGDVAANRLRRQFRVVLVDEFQDTDPVQWDILRRAFAGHSTLILIGDPKQAIYGFRGADVYCYLDAVSEASTVGTLDTNWRSDAALVQALDALFGQVSLGDPRIRVRRVRAHHQQRRLLPAQHSLPGASAGPSTGEAAASAAPGEVQAPDETQLKPVRIRVEPYHPDPEPLPRVGDLRRRIAHDLVADIASLLAQRPLLDLDGRRRTIEPSDIAVLVRRNKRGEEIRDALLDANIPAVVLGANSVYAGDLAQQWLTLLTALEQPRQATIRAASLTCFMGWTMYELATASEQQLTKLAARVRRWSRLLSDHGVATLMEAISSETRLTSRLLSASGGERRLTDLRHIAQSLDGAMSSGQLGVASLVDWLRQHVDEAQNTSMDDRSRRLESDAKAVQILTVHRSKGLQFPIVYLPEAWDRYTKSEDDGRPLRLHDVSGESGHEQGAGQDGPDAGDLVLDIGGVAGPGRPDRFTRCRREEAGEDLRVAYVAFTRAQLQVVTWWAPSWNTPASALQRFLYRPQATGQDKPCDRYEISCDPLALPQMGSGVSVEQMEPRDICRWRTEPVGSARLSRRVFNRPLDLDWRRTSYTALTAAAHDAGTSEPVVASEPEPEREDDESPAADLVAELVGAWPDSGEPSQQAPVSPMDELPTGAAFGTLVHAVLERVDPRDDQLESALQSIAADELARLPAQPMSAGELATATLPALHTPLGPLADDRRLVDFAVTDRLTELDFELPLAGGDRPHADVRLGDVAGLLADHLPATDPLISYPQMLSQPGLAQQPLRGFLTGSIDAVLRTRSPAGEPRYLVTDYKTNWLGGDERPLRVSAYSPDQLPAVMMHAHYPLQALLYSAALHRFLRWRQPGYHPDDHLAGVLYLFVRGMAGAATPRFNGAPCGVFSWRPPTRMITELSDLLDHGSSIADVTRPGVGGIR